MTAIGSQQQKKTYVCMVSTGINANNIDYNYTQVSLDTYDTLDFINIKRCHVDRFKVIL